MKTLPKAVQRHLPRFLASMMVLAGTGTIWSQENENVWISNVTGETIAENITPAQAKDRAKANAYAEALRQLGIEINATQFMVQSEAYNSSTQQRRANDAFLNVVRTGTQGFVTEVRNVRWQTENIETDPIRPPIIRYRVTLDARVTRPKGQKDQSFYVGLKINQRTFKEGEKVVLQITPSKECYLYVFNVASDSVRLLFPHEYASENHVGAQETLTFPPSLMAWRTYLPEGWESSEELVMVIASKEKREFRGGGVVDREGYLSTREAALMELMEWIAGMPTGEVAEAVERLEIVRK